MTVERPDFVPAPELRISDLETLRVLADPLRLRILEAFGAHPDMALTVKAIAGALAEPATKLYYHFNLLEERGLVVVVETHLVSGILEKRYRVAADTIQIDRSIIGAGGAVVDAETQTLLDAVFGATRKSLELSLRAGHARIGVDEPAPQRVVIARSTEWLTPDAATQARRRIAALVREIHELALSGTPAERRPAVSGRTALPAGPDTPSTEPSEPAEDRARSYALLVVFHPLSEEPSEDEGPGQERGR